MRSDCWIRWLPWVSLLAFTALWLARWPAFPLLLDPYYHLLIARQVVEAGGPIAYESWEYAPIGRPHLYPPVLHLVLATLLKAGCDPLTAIRLLSVALLPGLLLSLFLVARRLFSPSIALTCLWVAMVPFSFHLHTAITLAATLGLIEFIWLMDALERGRPLAAGLLVALLSYTHLGLPWAALLAMSAYSLLRPDRAREVIKAGWGFLPALPWWWHVGVHRDFLHVVARYENARVELLPLLYAAALVGAWICWRRRGPFAWPLACWVGFTLFAPRHAYRWLSGEGMVPVLLMAGVGIDWLAQGVLRVVPRAGRPETTRGRPSPIQGRLATAALMLVLVASPAVGHAETGWRWRWFDAAPLHLLGCPWSEAKELELGLSSPPVDRLVRVVEAESRPGEILWSNLPYAGGLVAALAGRPMSTAMLNEVPPAAAFDPIGAAHLVVWFRIEPIPGTVTLAQLRRYPLTPVAEDQLVVVFRRSGAGRKAPAPQAALPLWVALALLGTAVGVIAKDLASPARAQAGAALN